MNFIGRLLFLGILLCIPNLQQLAYAEGADYVGLPARAAGPSFKSEEAFLSKCIQGTESANIKCFESANKILGAGNAGQAAVEGSVSASDNVDLAQGAQLMGAISKSAGQTIIGTCVSAKSICRMACTAVKKEIAAAIAVYTKTNNQDKISKLNSDDKEASEQINRCGKTFDQVILLAGQQSSTGYAAINQAMQTEAAVTKGGDGFASAGVTDGDGGGDGKGKGVGDWIMDHKGTIALGALGAFGVSRLLKKDDDDDSPDTTETAQELAVAAAADPTCQSERSYEFSHCQNYLKSLCAKPAEMDNAKCVKFADQYCGFYTSTKAKVEGSPAEGLDTQLCADTMAHSYCAKVDRAGCYSCLRMRDMATPTCQSQPAACERTPSDAEMTQYKAACTDDPVFALPKWAHIPAPTSKATAAVVSGAGTLTTSSIMGEGTASLASKSVVLPADVAPERGPTILAQTTQAIQKLCLDGALNNCGVRRGVQ